MANRRLLEKALIVAALLVALLTLGHPGQSPALAISHTVRVDSTAIPAGAAGTVSVEAIDIPPPGLGAWSIDVVYDSAVVSAVDCQAEHSAFCNSAFSEEAVRISGVSLTGLQGTFGLATISFRCDQVGSTDLSLVLTVFHDVTVGSPQPVGAATDAGTISCLPAEGPLSEARIDAYGGYAVLADQFSCARETIADVASLQQTFSSVDGLYAGLLALAFSQNMQSLVEDSKQVIAGTESFLGGLGVSLDVVIPTVTASWNDCANAALLELRLEEMEMLVDQERSARDLEDLVAVQDALRNQMMELMAGGDIGCGPPETFAARATTAGAKRIAECLLEFSNDSGNAVAIDLADLVLAFIESDLEAIINMEALVSSGSTLSLLLGSPADLHLSNMLGDHTGALYDGQGDVVGIESLIPGSLYSGPFGGAERLVVFDPAGPLSMEILGTGAGEITVEVLGMKGSQISRMHFQSVAAQGSSFEVDLMIEQGPADELLVCPSTPGLPPGNPCSEDFDGDGCASGVEHGSNPFFGGSRDPASFWDFFDPNSDGAVTVVDFFAVLQRFTAVGDPGIDPLSDPPPPPAYHPRFDRGTVAGPNPWNAGPANGAITVTDFFSLLTQFGHVCA